MRSIEARSPARILACSESRGGVFAPEDLSEYQAEWVTPLTTNYRGWDVYEIPPNSQGIAALVMLNILENFPIREYGRGTVDTLHTLIEAKKLAYADMQRHVGDPRFSKVPVEALLSKAYARERAGLIDPRRAANDVSRRHACRCTAATRRICAPSMRRETWPRSSRVTSPTSGPASFPTARDSRSRAAAGCSRSIASHPNALAPRKRPLQTVIPAFMKRDHVRVGFGVMGGWNQPQAHVQVISNIVDHGLNIQQALEAPRFVKLTFAGTDVMMESRFPEDVRDGLARRGHAIDLQGEFSNMVGGGQAVMRDERAKVNYGASDPRKDGAAIPEPLL